ncbi:MAG: 1-aminocyclopropane-1-carboxylate deaminase/D-cysteine desulfhydrase [Pseudomonadota bacterium]
MSNSDLSRQADRPVRLPPRLELARLPTPLRRLRRFPGIPDGARLWIKHDEQTGTELSGNKVRKLEFTLAHALEQGHDTLITCGGTQSNHARATAILGARLGLSVHLVLRGDPPDSAPDGNLLLDHLAGASVHYLPRSEWHTHEAVAEQLRQSLARDGHRALFIPTGASDEIGLWGYVAACAELREDFRAADLRPDVIAVATGSGGTQSGLIAGNALYGLGARIMAFNVCDDADWFHDKVSSDLGRWQRRYRECLPAGFDAARLDIHTVDGHVGPGYGEALPPVYETIASLARSEGVFLDPVYTGKAFHGLMREWRDGALKGARDVVFVHTGGLFGLFPHRRYFPVN